MSRDPGPETGGVDRPRLTRIQVQGFRSLRNVSLDLSQVTVLIGPNGAGKSNLLWALEMVRLLAYGGLQTFVGERGGASFLMHYGPRQTAAIELVLEFESSGRGNAYWARLGYGADESLIFLAELAGFRRGPSEAWQWTQMGAGHRESQLKEFSQNDTTARTVYWLLKQINFYHFHDTSRRSPLRTRPFADLTGKFLRSDGSNLPNFLLALRESRDSAAQASWRRIEGALKRVAPFIASLEPNEDRHGVKLEWVDDQGATFGPAHLSDGTLRALALISCLWQPEENLPLVSCIDEPELGLHPAALGLLCGLISSVSTRHQVIVSTQSPVILDHFQPQDVVVTERVEGSSCFRRLSAEDLASWLVDYRLSELYDKNLLGGRP